MKTSTIPTLLGPDGMTSLREYAGYHGGGSGFGGQLRAWNPPSESGWMQPAAQLYPWQCPRDDLVRNNGYAANAIQLHQDHIVGSFSGSVIAKLALSGHRGGRSPCFPARLKRHGKSFAEDDCCCIDVERKPHVYHDDSGRWPCTPLTVNCSFRPPGDTSSSRLFRTQFRMVSPKRISNLNNTGDSRKLPCRCAD